MPAGLVTRAFITRFSPVVTRALPGSREREPRSLAITKPAWAPKASAIRKKNAKEAEKQPRGRTGCAKPASPSSRYWRTGRGGRRTPTLMMLDESEEGAGEEDGEEDGRTEKESEHGGGISAASGAAAGADPPPPAPQATEQHDQPAAPRGRAARGCWQLWDDSSSIS